MWAFLTSREPLITSPFSSSISIPSDLTILLFKTLQCLLLSLGVKPQLLQWPPRPYKMPAPSPSPLPLPDLTCHSGAPSPSALATVAPAVPEATPPSSPRLSSLSAPAFPPSSRFFPRHAQDLLLAMLLKCHLLREAPLATLLENHSVALLIPFSALFLFPETPSSCHSRHFTHPGTEVKM